MDENTKELETLNDLTKIEDNVLDFTSEIQSINEDLDRVGGTIDGIEKLTDNIEDVKVKKKLKDKIKEKWQSFSKKKKIGIIVIVIIILLTIIGLITFLILNNKKDNKVEEKEDVILEVDNYRYENGKLILLGDKDKELGKYNCKNKDEKLCYVAYYEKDEKIDNPKKIDEEGNILDTRSAIVNDKYVFIHDSKKEDDEKVNLYDIKDGKTLDEYNAIKYIKNNYAIVKDYTGSYGIIELNDEVLTKIQFNYDNLAIISDNDKVNIIANESGRNYLIDINEKILTKAISMDIVNYNDKFLVAVDDEGKYYLYDYKNNLVYDDSFDYIKLFSDYNLFIKDKKAFLNTSDGAKLTENGFDINNKYKYYQKLYIYDDDNKLSDTYEAFSVKDNTTSITLTIDSKDYVVSKIEGKISAASKYVNYFDGILYIYDNPDKTNLIGEYKCTNKNILSENSTSFENCYITSDSTLKSDNDMSSTTSSGMIPILNHRFVFIKDNPNAVSEGNTNIVLYDLSTKKVISKYLSVNSTLNTNINEPSLQTESNINIIAKNNKNKYGIVKISDSGVSSVLPFNYSSLEIIGNYYLVNNDGYILVDKTGKEISKKINAKIRGYNTKYIKAIENNMYYVYDYNGNRINTAGSKYIELYDNYFATVDATNKLNIYAYSDPSKPLIKDSIQLASDKYYGEGALAFRISFVSTSANVSILKDGNYISSVYSLVETPQNSSENTTNEGGNNE